MQTRLFGPLFILSFLFLFAGTYSSAMTINRLNGGASVVYVDFSIPGTTVPLELVRTYSSITALNENVGWNGAFGWGWTTTFETTLTTTPERTVLLRDGLTGNTVTFRPEKEDPKVQETFIQNVKRAYYEQRIGRKLSEAELEKMTLPDKMTSRIKTDSQYRIEVAIKFNIKATIPRGEVLVSSEYGYQTIQFRNNQWIREKDGIYQFFDKEGRLTRQKDKNGFYFDFKYSTTNRTQVIEVDAQDRVTTLKFTWRNDRVVEATDNRNRKAKFTYDQAGNLTQTTDSNGVSHIYKYENKKFPHVLTRVDYVTESATAKEKIFRELKYDDNGLVVYHREKDGAEITYTYGKKSNDPENNFWTRSVRKFAGSSDEQYDEFFVKARTDGSKYLFKQESKLGGVATTTLFAPCCAKPTQIIRNGEVTNFKYYDNGLLSEKVGPKEDIRLEYDPRWKKVSKINQNGFVSNYTYDDHGNLVTASNSNDQKVSLKYDNIGRIAEMVDPEGKQISFKYGETGKPTLIMEKGVGTIRINYATDGKITKIETVLPAEKGRRPSEARSQEVVRRVMKSFQGLLDILRPAGLNLIPA